MAWTSPMTFAANNVLTAAQLNTHLRDNLLETAPAKASTAAGIFVSEKPNVIKERVIKAARVAATESTTSGNYVNLSTKGPSVTCETGTNALVIITTTVGNTADFAASYMSYAVTGDSDIEPKDEVAYCINGVGNAKNTRISSISLIDNLTPGVNIFTAKYKAEGGSPISTFSDRFIAVLPL